LLVAGTTASAAAFADDHDRLRGTYAFTGTSSCRKTSASIGFNSKFTPNGPPGCYNTTNEAVRVFCADGTGTVKSRSVSVSAPPFAGASSGEYSPVHLHDRPRWQTVDHDGTRHIQGVRS
jgi:hypothetical protein